MNPYAPPPAAPLPVSGFAPPPAAPPSGPPLFSSNAIALTSFLASPLAGGLLLAWNLQKTKRAGAAALTALASTLFLLGFLALAIFTNLPSAVYTGISVGGAVGLRAAAVKMFPGPTNVASPWLAALVGVGSVIAIVMLAFGISLFAPESKVDLGNQVSAYYEDGASKEDATRLGRYLVDKGFLVKDADVRVARPHTNDVKISFVVSDGSWDKPDIVAQYQTMASEIATDVFAGKSLSIVLVSTMLVEKRTISVPASSAK